MTGEPDHGGADAGVSHMKRLLNGRDNFIVSKGLWSEFVDTLSKPAPVAANVSAEARLREARDKFWSRRSTDDVWLCRDKAATEAMIQIGDNQIRCSWEQIQILLDVIQRENGSLMAAHPHASDCDKQGER